eukprot:5458609-Prymnesium_polylepis.1
MTVRRRVSISAPPVMPQIRLHTPWYGATDAGSQDRHPCARRRLPHLVATRILGAARDVSQADA